MYDDGNIKERAEIYKDKSHHNIFLWFKEFITWKKKERWPSLYLRVFDFLLESNISSVQWWLKLKYPVEYWCWKLSRSYFHLVVTLNVIQSSPNSKKYQKGKKIGIRKFLFTNFTKTRNLKKNHTKEKGLLRYLLC